MQFKDCNSCYRIQNRAFSVLLEWGTEFYPIGMKTNMEDPNIFFKKYNSPYHTEMGTYILIDLL